MHAVSTEAGQDVPLVVASDDSSSAREPAEVDATGGAFGPRVTILLTAATVVVLAIGLVLRFWTRSDLWLDEALTVDIARLPLHDLPAYLRRDGAPPLYYALLHLWMGVFGQSDLAVRALSGVFGVVTIPLVWLAGRRLAGKTAAWSATVLLATSPFAVRYDTETRMYALVALLTVVGFLALDRSLQRPKAGNLIAVALVTGALLYTQYWSLYLVAVVFLWLAFEAWRGRLAWRRHARSSMGAMVVGGLTFIPWLPTFFFQSAHTGTPWATPANFAAMVNAISSFAGGGTNQGRALALIYFALIGLGLFGVARGRRHIELDIRTRPLGRPLGIVIVATLALAIIGGFLSHSAFDPRYASVVFVPLILLVSLGLDTFWDRTIRTVILTVAVLAGLLASFPNITTNRTQAGEVAATIRLQARPGDVVAYCPDQLGPAVARLLPSTAYRQITFPRGTSPDFVNWVDYGAASRAGRPVMFASRLKSMAAGGHRIFVVWAPGYQTFGTKCEQLVETLQGAGSGYATASLVQLNAANFFQPMDLYKFTPTSG